MNNFAALRRQLVDNQIRTSAVTDHELIQAFLAVPRERFVEAAEQPFAYTDRELRMSPSASDRRLSPPVQQARMIQALSLAPGDRAMVVGAGTGYSAALLSRLVGEVVAVEEHKELAELALKALAREDTANVTVIAGRLIDGYAKADPYDAILIDGAVEHVPAGLIAQLAPGGRLAVVERDERISRAMLYEHVGSQAARWPLFEAWAALLPGFERAKEFVF